ncbi:MAG: DUF4280 domain-containing protein [Opitutaceae bacterium]|nr:DUF4280 domain-containing protein [Cytophagales bacterium]
MADPKEPENSKPKKSGYLVCDGAMCKCDSGAAPAKIKVTKNTKIYINNEKLLVTETDTIFTPPSGTFGVCSKKPPQANTCVPVFQPKWTKPYDSIETAGGKVITDKSELQCTVGGKVTIVMHGQVQVVSPAQAENQDKKIATQVNALADPAKSLKKAPSVSVQAITGEVVPDPKFEPVTNQSPGNTKSATIENTDAPDLFLRPGQKAKFTATYTGTEPLVCWKLQTPENPDPIYFLRQGKEFTTAFNELGKYRIEGYGTGTDGKVDADTYEGTEVSRVEDSKCVLEIVVGPNKLTGLKHLTSENVIVSATKEIQARAGVPISFEPVFLMPAVQEDIENLVMVVKDNGGAELFREAGKPMLTYTPENTDCAFLVEFYIPSDPESLAKLNFRTVKNTVSVIAPKGIKEGESKIRPGCELTFTVSGYKFKGEASAEIQEKENKLIKWYQHSQWHGSNITPVATGKSYTKKYDKEGKYIVKCAVNVVSKTWFTSGKDENDDWRFEVTKNYPVGIEQKSTGKIKVGKPANFRLKGIFEIIRAEELDIKWNLTGPETKQLEHKKDFFFTLKKLGKYTLTASMNGKSVQQAIEFECIQAEIVKGWWTDSDGNMLSGEEEDEQTNTLGRAGWDQEVCLSFKHIGLHGETVEVEVSDSDMGADDSLFKKDITIPENGSVAKLSFKLDDKLKKKVQNKSDWITDSYGKLYFTVKSKGAIDILNNGMSLPQDSGQYLIVDEKQKVIAYFSDNNDTKRYTSAELSEPVYIQVKSRGLQKADLELEIIENFEDEKTIGKRTSFKVDKYGVASVKLKMDDIKPLVPKASDTIQLSTKVYKKDVKEALYDSSGKYTLTVHKMLKSGPVSKGTSKAFVMVDYSKLEKSEQKVCECEARVRAFMRMLRVGEGTEGESGYIKAFGGNIIKDLSTHPKKNFGGSSAAGAYQIMGYTYAWLGGSKLEWTGEYFKILDEYEKNHDFINKHGIIGFFPESQDKLCICLMKDKTGLIESIISGKIEKGIRNYASSIWASLPYEGDNSRYKFKGKLQPSTPMEECLSNFDKFLKQELSKKTDLHLEDGFLEEFGFNCTCNSNILEESNCSCGKKHFNNSKPEHWITQQPKQCWAASVQILKNYGVTGGSREDFLIIANQKREKLTSTNPQIGIDYIDSQLKKGNPVVVGVDDNLRVSDYNVHKATDHFFVIVASGCENGKRFYRFFDVGSAKLEQGTNENNKLFIEKDLLIQGFSSSKSHFYTVTEIRKNKI